MYDELGSYYYRWKEYPNAIKYLLLATKRPCPETTWHALANCYTSTKQTKKALAVWQYCVKNYKNDALAPSRVKRLQAKLASESRSI